MSDQAGSGPTPASLFRPESQGDQAVDFMVMLLDRQDAALPITRLRDWAIEKAAPRAGETVVDVGSGTGTMVRRFAALVGPTGRAVGVEPNERLRALAHQRTEGAPTRSPDDSGSGAEEARGAAPVTFVDGFADHLPLDDDSVDLLWCERVLQHLSDPQAAIDEFFRVLRRGGRAVLLDSDHGSRIVSDIDPDVVRRINEAFMRSNPNPYAARHVPRQALQAGFELDPDFGSAALMQLPPDSRGLGLIQIAAEGAVAERTITPEEREAALAVHRAAIEGGWAFVAVTVFAFLLTKPSSPDRDRTVELPVTLRR